MYVQNVHTYIRTYIVRHISTRVPGTVYVQGMWRHIAVLALIQLQIRMSSLYTTVQKEESPVLIGEWSHLKWAHQSLIHTHHCTGIVKFATVVWSREQRHQLTLGKELITVLHHLKERREKDSNLMKWGILSNVMLGVITVLKSYNYTFITLVDLVLEVIISSHTRCS